MDRDEVWRCYRGVTSRHHLERILIGIEQSMMALDAAPERLRQLVHEFDTTEARQRWQAEQLADRCPHGRWRPKCAQCAYAAATRR